MLRILHDTRIDFIRAWRPATLAILAFLVPGLIWIAISGFQYSIEFTGGTLAQLEFRQTPDISEVRSALGASGLNGVEIQTFGSPNELVVRAQDERSVAQQAAGAETVAARIRGALDRKFGAGSYRVVRTEAVGPRVGSELRRNAMVAMLISFGATLLYLAWRFEWRLSVAALLGNIHDIVATFVFIKYMDIEITLFVIGGILTVIGYSLSDTVVVFDRVREILRSREKLPLRDVLNRAVNETLPRTVMTGTTVIACLLALIIFGGNVLRPFAWVLLFGIIVGTLSSIYVASPLYLWIEHRFPRRAGADVAPKSRAAARPAPEAAPSARQAAR